MIIDKTKPHAVFLDIDGTLMAPGKLLLLSEGKIPPKNIVFSSFYVIIDNERRKLWLNILMII